MGDSVDRRAGERLPVGPATGCSFVAPVAADFAGVRLRDISMNGIGLVTVQRVDVGARLVVGITNTAHAIVKTMLVRVTHVKPITGGYLIGAEFVNPLTYQEFTNLVM